MLVHQMEGSDWSEGRMQVHPKLALTSARGDEHKVFSIRDKARRILLCPNRFIHDGNTNWIFATHFSFTHLPTSTAEKTKNYQQKLIRFNDQTQLYDLFYHPLFSYFIFVHYSVLILLILWKKTFNWQATLKRHYCMATV